MTKKRSTDVSALKWYEIRAHAPQAAGDDGPKSADVYIYGDIGDTWDENSVTAADFVRDINALDVEQINLRINSYGGSVPDSMAMYNALKRHKASVDTYVDGVALSCASYIAMAGSTVTMAKNAQMMIHAPWGLSIGNAKEMREAADVLDRYGKTLAHGYADKSGKGYDEAFALLSDGADHWFLADEAVAEGFADVVGEEALAAMALARSFDTSRFKPQASGKPVLQPAAAAAQPEEHLMPKPETPAAQPAATPEPVATQPFARTKDDNLQINAAFQPFMHLDNVRALRDEILTDPSIPVAQAREQLLTKLGEGVEPINPQGAHPRIDTVADETDKQRDAAVQALLVRSGVEQDRNVRLAMGSNPYRGRTLTDMARMSLDRAGVRTDGMSRMDVVGAAFTQGTSDFPVLLENAMHKSLQSAYALAPMTWSRFCATGSVSDFRAHNRYRLGSFGALDPVTELGEYVNKTIPDGEKASISADTKGNIINLSRQAIINDDLGAFVGLAASLGRAAARTVEVDVYALLALNAGMGPTISGAALFDDAHGNKAADGAVSVDVLDSMRQKMASQKDVSGNDFLDLRPAVVICPIGYEGTLRVLNESMYDPSQAAPAQQPNIVRGMFTDIVGTPRLTGTRLYAFADPAVAPVIEVAFLDGAQEPFLDQKEGFDVDGARYKVRLDYGVAAIDYRGAVTAKGDS